MHKYGHGDNKLKCPNFSGSHLLSREYFPTENGGKYFPTKIAGNYFPVENVFHRADEFSLIVCSSPGFIC